MRSPNRIEFGDWQTPDDLANRVLTCVLSRLASQPRVVLEPTCGKGSFLAAAAHHLPSAELTGYEINSEYVAIAASRVDAKRQHLHVADFFSVDWDREVARANGPLLVLGNPPWVTNSDLGALQSSNLPFKQNIKGLSGFDARTGKSNFDVCEWMILRLLAALVRKPVDATLAMLCKSAVARRVIEFAARQKWPVQPGAVWRVDASRHFDAAVDAVLFVCHISHGANTRDSSWAVYPSLEAPAPESCFGVVGGTLVADSVAYSRTLALSGACDPEWRSGLKHDCARVMELERRGCMWVTSGGEVVDVEPEFLYPLLKSSDVANGRPPSERLVIVPQRSLGEDTTALKERAPKLWSYLMCHRSEFAGRKSSIYRNQPPFSIFGIGEYSFAPWKVAISGLYKRLHFTLVGPQSGRPVMLDDTCYFLPFATEDSARRALHALESELAREFFRGRVFWDAKRPISKSILQSVDLGRLMAELGLRDAEPRQPVQQSLAF